MKQKIDDKGVRRLQGNNVARNDKCSHNLMFLFNMFRKIVYNAIVKF